MQTYDRPRDQLDLTLAPDAPLLDTLRWAIAHAALAPSELNSQPWLFRVELLPPGTGARLELHLDPQRSLPALDPDGREGVLACGAALLNLRLALHGSGIDTAVQRSPHPDRPEVLAEITVRGRAVEQLTQRQLRLAIPLRRTHRGSFDPGPLPQAIIDGLVTEAGYEGAPVAVLSHEEQDLVHVLNADAARRLQSQAPVREEVAEWSRSNASSSPDGIPGSSHGLSSWRAWLEPGRIRAGRSRVAAEELAAQDLDRTPLLIVVGSAGESRDSLLRSGSGMQRLLLRATHLGVAASYQNAALHVPELRGDLARAVQLDHPQVVLRLGWGHGGELSPRRSEPFQLVPPGAPR
jgi:hypothetical protein